MQTNHHDIDIKFMHRAMELAARGLGSVSPNPMVGCVITHNGTLVGEGWHRVYGGPHAEVNAIESVRDKSVLIDCDVYVTLEPCSHFGKTPPCADLLIHHRVKRVVVSNVDPNPLVGGSGLKKLRQAGIEVVSGVLEKEGRLLNSRYFTHIEKKRPFILLKWAQTSDGFIARENFDSKWISNAVSRQLVHKWRSEEDSVMVGTTTAFHDNPELTVRDWSGRNPTRIVLDRFLRLSEKLKLFDGSAPTLCYNLLKHEERKNLGLIRIDEENMLTGLLHDLNNRRIQSVMVEGGSHTLNAFLEVGLWDEARVFVSPKKFGKGIKAPKLDGILVSNETIESDQLYFYSPIQH